MPSQLFPGWGNPNPGAIDQAFYRPALHAKLLPFGNGVHLAVAFLPQVPEPLVMHLFMPSGGDEARCGLVLVDRPVAVDLCATWLRLGRRPERLRRALSVIEAATIADDGLRIVLGSQLGTQHGAAAADWLRCRAHALAPFRIWAM